MAIEKDPFTIKWYLDDRKNRKLPEYKYSKAPLKIDIYHRQTKKHKHIHANEYFTRSEWEFFQSINVSNPHKHATKQQIQLKANLDAIIANVRSYNDSKIANTLAEFNAALSGKVVSKKTGPAYLFSIFDKYIDSKENSQTATYYAAARKKFFEFTMVHLKGKDPSSFLIEDLNEHYISIFRLWYQNQTINNSKESANSYLRGLRAVLNWASKPQQKYIKKKKNVFYYAEIVLPEAKRRAEEYTLTEQELKIFTQVVASTKEEERAKDLFIFMFLFDGIRIGDVMRLEQQNIKVRNGIRWMNFTPKKTQKHGKSSRVELTPDIQYFIDRWPGDEKYIFDILTKDMDEIQVAKKIKSKTSTINRNLKTLGIKCGFERHISNSSARYSVNHYLTTKGYATREQQSQMMVNSPKVNEGYFDSRDEKFKIQRKLSGILLKDKEAVLKEGQANLIDMAKDKEQKERFTNFFKMSDELYKRMGDHEALKKLTDPQKQKLTDQVNYITGVLNDYQSLWSNIQSEKMKELLKNHKNPNDAHI